jgi:hypothetical protein
VSGYRRTTYRAAPKARWMDLRYPGTCAGGGEPLPAGTRAFYDPADRTVCCTNLAHAETYGVTTTEWRGSPVSGRNVTTLSAYRLASAGGPTRHKQRYGRCEDAPCCGCCD